METTQLTLFGKMSPEHSPATKAKISGSSSKASRESATQAPLFLDLRKAASLLSGETRAASWETDGRLPLDFATRNFGASPKGAVESTLSRILEDSAPPKYFLSAKACRGVLRRAKQRGKELPELLRDALNWQIAHMDALERAGIRIRNT